MDSLNPFKQSSINTKNTNSNSGLTSIFGSNVNTLKSKASGMNPILMILLFGLFVAGLIYIMIIVKGPKDISYTLAEVPIKANSGSIKSVKNSNKLPSSKSSTKYALSFWIYIEAIENQDDYRLVLKRGGASGALQSSNPLIYFDKMSNKMIIKVKTLQADKEGISFTKLDSVVGNQGQIFTKDNCYYATFIIDYVPMQTWVNVLLNVDNNIISLFMNGEKHSTRVLNENNDDCPSDLSNVVSPSTGDIQVGNIPSGIHSFNGYLSKIQSFDHSLKTTNDVKAIYSKGPVASKSILQHLGLPLYGFRNPLYKIDGVNKQKTDV
jgi:hypothetical protein